MNYEEPGYKERFPEWRSSDGALRVEKEKGNKPLPGYAPSEKERRQGDAPKKVYALKNSYGTWAVGINKRRELVTVASRQRTKDLKALPQISQRLEGETARRVPLVKGNVQVNEPRYQQAQSAFGYRERSSRGTPFVMNKLEKLNSREDLQGAQSVAPFLHRDKEKEELRFLREQARKLVETGDQEEQRGVEKRIQFLTAVQADKERNWQRLYTAMPELLTAARKGVRTEVRWTRAGIAAAEVSAGGEENTGDGTDANRGKAGKPQKADAPLATEATTATPAAENQPDKRSAPTVKTDRARKKAARDAARERRNPSEAE
jgi:hypothetical protein